MHLAIKIFVGNNKRSEKIYNSMEDIRQKSDETHFNSEIMYISIKKQCTLLCPLFITPNYRRLFLNMNFPEIIKRPYKYFPTLL